MNTAELFYGAGSLAFVVVILINRVRAPAVLPPQILNKLRSRKWTAKQLRTAIAPGALAAVLGLVTLQLYFWPVFCGLSLLMLGSTLLLWVMEKVAPRSSFAWKISWSLAVYVAIGVLLAMPSLRFSHFSWSPRDFFSVPAALLILALICAGLLLVVTSVMAYFAVVGEIARVVHPLRPTGPSLDVRLRALVSLLHQLQQPKPAEVKEALNLIYVSLALIPVRILVDFTFLASAGLVFSLMINAIGLAAVLLLVVNIAQGRNWARVTFLILFALSAPFFLRTGPGEFAQSRNIHHESVSACDARLRLRSSAEDTCGSILSHLKPGNGSQVLPLGFDPKYGAVVSDGLRLFAVSSKHLPSEIPQPCASNQASAKQGDPATNDHPCDDSIEI